MKYRLNELIHAKGITETVQEALMVLLHENEELRVKLKELENQKPVAQPNLSDPAVQKRLAAQWGYVPAPSVPEGWKLVPIEPTVTMKQATDHIDLGDSDVGRYVLAWSEIEALYKAMLAAAPEAKVEPSVPDGWKQIPEKHPTFDLVDLRLADGSVLCGCVPQSDGDYWWEGPSGEVFIDPKYAPATHWRLAAAPEANPCP